MEVYCIWLFCSELRAKLGLKPLEQNDDGDSQPGMQSGCLNYFQHKQTSSFYCTKLY